MMVFDRDGKFLRSWGEGLFSRAHGIHIDSDDNLYCTDDGDHTVRKITTEGKVLLTIGVPNQPAPFLSGKPFNRCTHTALSPKGEIYVSDGYGNSCVHKYSPDGKHLMCWGTTGTDPGQFNIAHNIATDEDGWVYVADRENHRVQVFDGNGKYELQWNNMHRPCALYCCAGGGKNPQFIIGELGPGMPVNSKHTNIGPRLTIVDKKGGVIARLGGEHGPGQETGRFLSPHGLAVDSKGDIYVGEVSYTNWPAPIPTCRCRSTCARCRSSRRSRDGGRDRLHLIGSIPLDNSEQVFRRLSDELGPFLRCMPDGETGERSRWVYFQRQMLLDHPAMEIDPTVPPYKFIQWDGKVVREIEQLRFKPGVDPATVKFETGYDKAATRLLGNLQAAARRRRHPRHVRFQVCLPTPQASGYLYVSGAARETYFGVYERALKTALDNIVRAIPAADLSIQWDVCQEVLAFENYFKDRPADYKKQTFDMLGRLGDAVPEGVEMGYHLCYGSPRDEHLVQPKDSAILVEMMNGIAAATRRRIDFLHIPVPRDRADDAYYAPIRDFKRPPGDQALSRPAAPRRRCRRQESASPWRGASAISACRPSAAGAAPSPGACPDS